MIVLNNVAVADTYTDALTVVSLSIENLSLFVFNNAVTIQVFKKNPGGGQNYELLPEQNMAPGSAQFPGAVGVRIKNASAGSVARVILVAPEFDPLSPDPGMVGYVPTTLTLTASGSVGQVGIIDRNVALVDVANTNVETNLYSFAVPGGLMTPGGGFLRLNMGGDWLFNNNAADGLIFRIRYGGSIVYQGSLANAALGLLGVRHPWTYLLYIVNLGATNSQMLNGSMAAEVSGSPAPTTGIGTWDIVRQLADQTTKPSLQGVSSPLAVDTTQVQTLTISVQWSVSSVNDSFRKRWAFLEVQ